MINGFAATLLMFSIGQSLASEVIAFQFLHENFPPWNGVVLPYKKSQLSPIPRTKSSIDWNSKLIYVEDYRDLNFVAWREVGKVICATKGKYDYITTAVQFLQKENKELQAYPLMDITGYMVAFQCCSNEDINSFAYFHNINGYSDTYVFKKYFKRYLQLIAD